MGQHKFNNVPSLGWLCENLKKYYNQRAKFIISKESFYYKYLVKDCGFDPTKPIGCNAIFGGILKKALDEADMFGRCPPNRTTVCFLFRDTLFIQGDKIAYATSQRRLNKKRITSFRHNEIIGFIDGLANQRSFKLEGMKRLASS